MKLLISSDIHGDRASLEAVISAFKKEGADKLLILGDLLYHGPRNDLPEGYAPKAVIEILNKNRDIILTVRGNCDTEVDQMVLDFPILADYVYLSLDGLSVLATHGHKYNKETPPPLRAGEILLPGHTHIPECVEFGDRNFCINPGSTSIPKGGFPKSYAIYNDRTFTVKDLDGNIILTKKFN